MQQEEKELRLNQLRLIVIVMTLIFAFMMVYTIYFLVDYKDKYGFFKKATAEVVEHQELNGKEYDLISYFVDGNEFRITTEYETKNDIGDTITIYYDINNPLGIVYSLDSRRIWLPILTTVFASANIGLCVMYILIRKGIIKAKLNKKEVVLEEIVVDEKHIEEVVEPVKNIKTATAKKTTNHKSTNLNKKSNNASKSSSTKANSSKVNKVNNSKSKSTQSKTKK